MRITALCKPQSIFFEMVSVSACTRIAAFTPSASSSRPTIVRISFSLHLRRNSLYTHRLSRRQPSHQLGQRPQVLSAETRPALRNHHDGIAGDHICPTGRKADHTPVVTVAVDAVFPPVVLVEEQL